MNAKEFEESCKTIEKWYKCIKYNVTKLSEDLITKWSEAPRHKDHCLPSPNEFIATNFQIKSPPNDLKNNKYPYLISVGCYFCIKRIYIRYRNKFSEYI